MLNRGYVCLGKYDDLNVHEAIRFVAIVPDQAEHLLSRVAKAPGFFFAEKIDAHRKAQARRS
jgi:hypothetical protein